LKFSFMWHQWNSSHWSCKVRSNSNNYWWS